MAEVYFAGFKFQEYPYFDFPIISREPVSQITIEPADTIYFNPPSIFRGALVERVFVEKLASLSKQINQPLTMQGRTFLFVPDEELLPKTKENKQDLIKKYGETIIENAAGDCTRHDDGTYTLRIGLDVAGMEEDDVLNTMAHEYGHTLGKSIDVPIFEELKAYAFAHLFMRHHWEVDILHIIAIGRSVHFKALDRVEQLQETGISIEAILAHLTGEVFAGYKPDDYRASLAAKLEWFPTPRVKYVPT